MEKIYEKLAAVLTPEDLNEIKQSFQSAVDEAVQAKLDVETKNLAKKAAEFYEAKLDEAIKAKTAELEELANKYCEQRCAKITENAQKKLDAQQKKLEEAAEQYIYRFFEEKFKERYGEELEQMEESMVESMDRWLEFTISEKISPNLIKQTAINETYEPIINVIKQAFEDKFVPLDTTGSAKIREAKAANAELRTSLDKQVKESMRLAEQLENANKKAIIAEKTNGLTAAQCARVKNFFESKSYSETKMDIDDYVNMICESAPRMIKPRAQRITESVKPKTHSLNIEDETQDIITEKYRPKKSMSDSDKFLLRAASFSGEM